MTNKTEVPENSPVGPLVTLASASFFAVITPLATLVYAAGGNSITLVLIRLLAVVILTIIVAIVLRKGPRVDKKNIPQMVAFSLCIFGQGICYLSSVAYIPVSFAALLLYTWPLMVAVASPLIGENRPTAFQMLCFLAAFTGLAFTFAPSLENLDPRGVILALLGACFTVGLILFSRIVLRTTNPLSVSFYGNTMALAFAAAFVPFTGGFALPESNNGFIALGLICLVFSCAIATQLIGLRMTKASLAAIIYNMEPVISILVAFILLGEILTPPQYLGGALVIGSLMLYSNSARKIAI